MAIAKKSIRVIGVGFAAVGLVLMAAGFALSGFDPHVFTSQIDRGTVVLGGQEVENPEKLPLLGIVAEMGAIDTSALAENDATPAASTASSVPEASPTSEASVGPKAPSAPETPAEPEAPTEPGVPIAS